MCGAIDLYSYDPLNRRAAVGIMVANEYRRQGYALAMLRELQQIATSNYKLHTLYADIAATNTASIALFRKAGYEECGRFKEWLNIDDTYIDTIRLQKIL
ncbi:MAG: GNAT family N-acetyltransferase [Bacteroidales bacterium]|nr:GNAT family N-acetyltransferase [Bacteroidales bacterium]